MKKLIDTEEITFDMIDAFLSKSNISEGVRAAIEAAPEAIRKLTRPAKVNGGNFMTGVDERLVIEAAQRQYQWWLEEKDKKQKPDDFNKLLACLHAGRIDDITRRAVLWSVSDDTGLSSKTIWAHMMAGMAPERGADYPRDVSDLGRCLRLLDRVPEWKPRIQEMAKYGKYWAALVERWDELAAMYAAEMLAHSGRTAPKTYAMMKSIFQGVKYEQA